jgi:hypothetical protein
MKRSRVNRRGFLKGAAAGAAALVGAPAAEAQQAPAALAAEIARPAGALARETETVPASLDVLTEGRPGSDFMVDVIKSLGIEYICSNPGSSFRGLQESVINYGGNVKPEWITCLHEEISVAMADGYAQVEDKPLIAATHWMPLTAGPASSGTTPFRMLRPQSAIFSNGTTIPFPCNTSPSLPCAPTKS